MKNKYITLSTGIASILKTLSPIAVLYLALLIFPLTSTQAQIWEPEGLNMPGAWNGWTNPPTNNLALASYTQVTGGRVTKISTGITRWQTIFSVAASGGDLVGGTYDWLFTSGPSGSPFQNKWAGVTVSMNTLQSYTFQGPNDNNITLVNNKWYTVVWKDNAYANTQAIFMETSAEPVTITSVSFPAGNIDPNQEVVVTVNTSLAVSAEELIYIRYTTNAWLTSSLLTVNMSGSTGTASIPGQPEGTNVEYYAFSSTVAGITSDFDLYTIHLNNNSENNYAYSVVGTPVFEISWTNLQNPDSGTIELGQEFNVFARVFANGITNDPGQGAGIQAWIGYSASNTNPDTWTDWIAATYSGDAASSDEYVANLGASITELGTFYYASRFQLDAQNYVYGGYSAGGGGFWDGTDNVSGVLTVTEEALSFPVFFKVIDETESYQAIELKGQMTDWATVPMQEDPQFTWTITLDIEPGTYEWGVIENDGTEFGIWLIVGPNLVVTVGPDGSISGETTYTVTAPPTPEIDWANLQHPPEGTIEPMQEFNVFGRVWISGITGSGSATEGLQAWVGYHIADTHPENWTNWVPAAYNGSTENNDEFMANLGSAIDEEGTYYYAYRYQYLEQDFVYGGYSAEGGGFWEAGVFVSGVLTVVTDLTPENLVVEGQTIGIGATECFDATNNITVSNTVIENGAFVEFRAGVSILFLSGFVVESGGSMHALISDVYCQPSSMLNSGEKIMAQEIYTASEPKSVFNVFPNPTSGRFTVRMNTNKESTGISIEIFSIIGERVMQTQLSGRQEYELDLTTLPRGVYVLRLFNGNEVATERVIKQ
jgi:hypothetical protein